MRTPYVLAGVIVLALATTVTGCRHHEATASVVSSSDGTSPIVTNGARTVVFHGPRRTFAEPATTDATVTTDAWVRLAPAAWFPGAEKDPVLGRWLRAEQSDRSPDLLAIAMQYRPGSPAIRDAQGHRIAGAATYGPQVGSDPAARRENSDFNDYLGVDWTYPDGTVRRAGLSRRGALDCSGFVRMVFGYRSGYPLEWIGGGAPDALPRRAVMMATYDVGVTMIPDRGSKVTDIRPLHAGDLVFFDADPDDGPAVDHVGIYLGVDSAGKPRFLSSRKTANGPTLGDVGGSALLTGNGLYAKAFREAKRL